MIQYIGPIYQCVTLQMNVSLAGKMCPVFSEALEETPKQESRCTKQTIMNPYKKKPKKKTAPQTETW